MPGMLEQFSLAGRTALVTGSSAGIGLALARALAGAVAQVVLNGRREAPLAEAAAQLRDQGAQVQTSCFDVADAAAVAAAVRHLEDEVAPLDIPVNNAGLQRREPLQDSALADWQALMRTNLDGVFIVGQAAARRMITRRRR